MDIEQQAVGGAPESVAADEQQKPRRTTRRRTPTAASTRVDTAGVEAAEANTAGTEAAVTEAAGTEAAGTEAAGTEAAVTEAAVTEAAAQQPEPDAGAAARAESPTGEGPIPEAQKPKRTPRSRRKPAAEAAEAADARAGAADARTEALQGEEAEAAAAEKPARARSRRRASARAAAVKDETRLPEAKGEAEPEQAEPEQAQAEGRGAPAGPQDNGPRAQTAALETAALETAASETAASRAKSSVRARRRASGRGGQGEDTARAGVSAGAAPASVSDGAVAPASVSDDDVPPAGVPDAAEARLGQEASRDEAAPQSGLAAIFGEALSPTSMIFQAPDLSVVVRPAPASEAAEDHEGEEEVEHEDEDDAELNGRRRRRGRGRRGRARGTEIDEGTEEHGGEAGPGEDGEEVTSRRRRRRRRGDADLELEGGLDDDPPGTVTRVRAPRTPSDSTSTRVQSVKGSTRLEAKKQRRRESRESGRRRHVITEAEFLARRESVDRQMVVRQNDDRIQIAVLEDGVLAEHFVSKTQQDSLIGNVYLGRVQNVLPSMEAAFVDIGRGRNAVLYAGEVNWDAAGLEGAPRRIENALKSGDSVLVQVTKDPVGHKGARLTSQISLPGRYLVYVPGGSMTGISRKLPDVERTRLKRILKDRLPEDAGVIVRTAAEGASEEELTHDINRLRAQWESIKEQASSTKVLAPELLYGEPDLTIKVVRDVFNEDFSKLIVSGEEAWDTIEAYVTYVAPDLLGRLEKYEGEEDIFAQWRIDEQIHKALDRKVFLPSGGSLVIDRTEAMTVIDVNTGKFTGSGGNLEETVTKNNIEAAEEIVRQLRLRDIGGIIVIDFIDMVLESNRDLVLRRLVECLGRDRTKHQVAEVTSLGLVQMTRKRMGTGLLEVFSETCEVCGGRGVITHDEPVERGNRPASTPAADHHTAPRTETNTSATGRKRRRRSGSQQTEAPAPAQAPAQIPTPAPAPPADDAERQARAQATRAALAAVAAAAHAAHAHDEEGRPHPEQPAEDDETAAAAAQAAVPAPAAVPANEPLSPIAASAPAARAEAVHRIDPAGVPAGPDGRTVLTIGGERIELPHGDVVHEVPAPEPVLSLDALSQAFDQLTGERHTAEGDRPARKRRSRGARSGQGSAEVTRVEDSTGAVGGQTRSAAAAPQTAKTAPPEDGGPMILGVGVPASEL